MSDSKKDSKNLSVKGIDESRFRLAFASSFKNEHHTFVVQKSEKLAAALYMVTGFIPTEDPIRVRLRTCALELISCATDPEKARTGRFDEGFAARCLEVGSILSLAQRAGFVSAMNAKVLCDEYADLASFVRRYSEKVFGGDSAVEVDRTLHVPQAPAELRAMQGPFAPNTGAPLRKAVLLEGQKDKRTNNYKRHLSRRDMILSLLDKKDKITVKDASLAIEGCSEKTIQRELIALVEEGVLLKEGERRWSTYRKA